MTRFDLWPLYEGSYDKVTIDFFEAFFIVSKMTPVTPTWPLRSNSW